MNLEKLRKNKSGKINIFLLLSSLALLFGLIYWFAWRQSAPAPDETSVPPAKSGLEKLEELLQMPAYRDLQKFGSWPLPIDPKGKSDPFLNTSPN